MGFQTATKLHEEMIEAVQHIVTEDDVEEVKKYFSQMTVGDIIDEALEE